MTDEQIKHMVSRFLGWKLPENFNPDDGISFDPIANRGWKFERRREPVGTNLFDAAQAEAMVRYLIDGMPTTQEPAPQMSEREWKLPALREAICNEIIDIMRVYDKQTAKNGYPDTPGGLEHMGDVWAMLGRWRDTLARTILGDVKPTGAE